MAAALCARSGIAAIMGSNTAATSGTKFGGREMTDGSKGADSGKPQWTQATPAGYMPGFGNDFETEARRGALPVGESAPQRMANGLYAEQLSGSPAPRRAAPTGAPGSTASARRCST